MGKIDVTMLIPSEIAKLSPAERARRQAVADEIRRTLKPQNAVFGGGWLTIRRFFQHRTVRDRGDLADKQPGETSADHAQRPAPRPTSHPP
jgi:hypothetical protein